jgi:hypothetical protein
VGNGPSRRVLRWPHVLARLMSERETGAPRPKLVLLNEEPLRGPTAPDFAVTITRAVRKRLMRLKRQQGFGRMVVLTPDDTPRGWPRMSSGSLAVWAMARLGFGTVYLYGLDGSAADDGHGAGKIERWERTMSEHRRARAGGGVVKLVRIWPRSVAWVGVEPIEGVTETVLMGRANRDG